MDVKTPTKAYGIYYFDPSDLCDGDLMHETNTCDEANAWVGSTNLFRLKPDGANRVEIHHFDSAGKGQRLLTYHVAASIG